MAMMASAGGEGTNRGGWQERQWLRAQHREGLGRSTVAGVGLRNGGPGVAVAKARAAV